MCMENCVHIFQCPFCAMFICPASGEWNRCAVPKYAKNMYELNIYSLSNVLTFPSLSFSLTSPFLLFPSSFFSVLPFSLPFSLLVSLSVSMLKAVLVNGEECKVSHAGGLFIRHSRAFRPCFPQIGFLSLSVQGH